MQIRGTQMTRGVTIVEVVVGISIAALVVVFTTHTLTRFVTLGGEIADTANALYLAEESLEMVRFIRDKRWSLITDLTPGTTYYLDITDTTIATTTVPETIGIFTRSFVITEVERDADDTPVTSGSTDPQSRYVTATVSWGTPPESVSLTTLLANITNP